MTRTEHKHLNTPDETRTFEKGKVDLVKTESGTIGRLTLLPGWKWSEHVGPTVGAARCIVEHVGVVLSGVATAAFDNGTTVELEEGSLFYIPGIPHDSWVVGDKPYVSLHLMGAEEYAK